MKTTTRQNAGLGVAGAGVANQLMQGGVAIPDSSLGWATFSLNALVTIVGLVMGFIKHTPTTDELADLPPSLPSESQATMREPTDGRLPR